MQKQQDSTWSRRRYQGISFHVNVIRFFSVNGLGNIGLLWIRGSELGVSKFITRLGGFSRQRRPWRYIVRRWGRLARLGFYQNSIQTKQKSDPDLHILFKKKLIIIIKIVPWIAYSEVKRFEEEGRVWKKKNYAWFRPCCWWWCLWACSLIQ